MQGIHERLVHDWDYWMHDKRICDRWGVAFASPQLQRLASLMPAKADLIQIRTPDDVGLTVGPNCCSVIDGAPVRGASQGGRGP
jgi:hypothetical protein